MYSKFKRFKQSEVVILFANNMPVSEDFKLSNRAFLFLLLCWQALNKQVNMTESKAEKWYFFLMLILNKTLPLYHSFANDKMKGFLKLSIQTIIIAGF